MKTLKQIFNDYGCDKGSGKNAHHYYRVYKKYFDSRRNDPINILEIGVYKGLSLKSFVEFFPNANIYGVDTFERLPFDDPRFEELHNNPRVTLIEADSTIPSVLHEQGIKFDFIIDDGSHHPRDQFATFTNYWDLVKSGGFYFIEDVWPQHLLSEEQKRRDAEKFKILGKYIKMTKYGQSYYDILVEEMQDNHAVGWDMVPYSNKPNSFIFEIEKP